MKKAADQAFSRAQVHVDSQHDVAKDLLSRRNFDVSYLRACPRIRKHAYAYNVHNVIYLRVYVATPVACQYADTSEHRHVTLLRLVFVFAWCVPLVASSGHGEASARAVKCRHAHDV